MTDDFRGIRRAEEVEREPFLSVWTITENPSDMPGYFVARRHDVIDGAQRATEYTMRARTLDEVREMLPPGLFCMPRDPDDESVIVESWI